MVEKNDDKKTHRAAAAAVAALRGTLFLHKFGTVLVLDDETGTIRTGISR